MTEDDKSDAYEKYLKKMDPEEYKRQEAQDASMKEMRDKIYAFVDSNLKLEKSIREDVKRYQNWFMQELDTQPDVIAKLRFVMEKEKEIFTLKQKAEVDGNGFDKKHYQNLLDNIIAPWKVNLRKNLELEKELATFTPPKKVTKLEPVIEITQKEDPIKKAEPVKPEVEVKAKPPLTTPDKRKFEEPSRKLEWSDPRIPVLLAELFFQKECIFENQKKLMEEFLTKGSCSTHIAWRKKGNLLITAFYDLMISKHLTAQKNFIAEKLPKCIFHATETQKPIVSKGTIIAALSPGTESGLRRSNKDDPEYIDVVAYLMENLKPSS